MCEWGGGGAQYLMLSSMRQGEASDSHWGVHAVMCGGRGGGHNI